MRSTRTPPEGWPTDTTTHFVPLPPEAWPEAIARAHALGNERGYPNDKEWGSTYEPCPHCGTRVVTLVGKDDAPHAPWELTRLLADAMPGSWRLRPWPRAHTMRRCRSLREGPGA